jgi:hypothetical protein
MRKVVASLLVVLGAIGLLAPSHALVGCTPANECQFQWFEYCKPGVVDPNIPCNGHLIDATHWESGPLLGNWLAFAHGTNWFMHFRDGVTGQELALGDTIHIDVGVSAEQRPNDPGNEFSNGAGNLDGLHVYVDTGPDGGAIGWAADVHNETCADYFVYVFVTAFPTADAGAQVTLDASNDAPSE